MSEGGIPEPRSDSGLKKEDSDDPLRWATSESFTFESDRYAHKTDKSATKFLSVN